MVILDFDNVLFYNKNEPFKSCASFLFDSGFDSGHLLDQYIKEKDAIFNLRLLYQFFDFHGALPSCLSFSSFREQLWSFRKNNSTSEDYIKLFVRTEFFDKLSASSIDSSLITVLTSRDALTVRSILTYNNLSVNAIISSTEAALSKSQIINQHKSYIYIDDMRENFDSLKHSDSTQLIWARWGNLRQSSDIDYGNHSYIVSDCCDHTCECLGAYLSKRRQYHSHLL